MLRYGIPPYRLPNELLDAEVKRITGLGCRIHYNKKLGDNLSYREIKQKYHATVLTIGSQKGTGVGCPGDDAGNVLSGIDFLRNIEMTGQKPDFSGKTVAVVGGGNTAMDCCRTAMRLGAERVMVVYRRTEKEMPANPIEIHESQEEGIEYLFLNNPVNISKDESGNIKSMTLIRMELGEPDASGRRRPVPVEGSEYDIVVDYLLAAIGQKTQVDFIDDINTYAGKGALQVNRWGDISTNPQTLQTGIENVFAAGDGVTGPATLIEAIAQARIASLSCHQYLSDEPVIPGPKEFISKKDNFREQKASEYSGRFARQARMEMPLIPPAERKNFKEIELGYTKEMAHNETSRCLECGCSEYFSCDLKTLCDEYGADQKRYEGDFKSYDIKFDHPYIEIDANKCILCSRCVRICRDIVGANALGLVNRGFDTYVAPSMGKSLTDTSCESCGLCISACPTGAITENNTFKPGPVRLEQNTDICNYCSLGCTLNYESHGGFTWKITGSEGRANPHGNLCRFGKFGYSYLNKSERITTPLLRKDGSFTRITFDEAFEIIREKIAEVLPDENTFFAGARLSNEELYLIQRFARGAVKTNNINSFHYLGRGNAYRTSSDQNTPLSQLPMASRIYLLGTDIHRENAVAGFMVNHARNFKSVPVCYINLNKGSALEKKADVVIHVESYYALIKAIIHYLLKGNKQNNLFIKDHCKGFHKYRKQILSEDYKGWIEASGLDQNTIEELADQYNLEQNAVLIFSEKNISGNEARELRNLALIAGKLGKTASGLICLKEKNNSQGLWDMGIAPSVTCGLRDINDPGLINELEKTWNTGLLPDSAHEDTIELLMDGMIKNIFIFGEDPVGCAVYREEIEAWFENFSFVVVQDYFMTETANMADLILPSSFPVELYGSFTNTQRMVQEFVPACRAAFSPDSPGQLIALGNSFGLNSLADSQDAREEAFRLIAGRKTEDKYKFFHTSHDDFICFFDHGCDSLVKMFEDEFEGSFPKPKL